MAMTYREFIDEARRLKFDPNTIAAFEKRVPNEGAADPDDYLKILYEEDHIVHAADYESMAAALKEECVI